MSSPSDVRKRLVGRRALRPAWPTRPARTFRRRRYPFSKRPVLRLAGRFNPLTLRRETVLGNKRPLFWVVGLLLLLVLPPLSAEPAAEAGEPAGESAGEPAQTAVETAPSPA